MQKLIECEAASPPWAWNFPDSLHDQPRYVDRTFHSAWLRIALWGRRDMDLVNRTAHLYRASLHVRCSLLVGCYFGRGLHWSRCSRSPRSRQTQPARWSFSSLLFHVKKIQHVDCFDRSIWPMASYKDKTGKPKSLSCSWWLPLFSRLPGPIQGCPGHIALQPFGFFIDGQHAWWWGCRLCGKSWTDLSAPSMVISGNPILGVTNLLWSLHLYNGQFLNMIVLWL